ncbi:RteC domain-containing protein [Pedobacter gandavensis]|uniref:RteC domain-containing protein n=1 Tax=Pedobacter gandavensis TaxID=2679963 RepID=UPI00247883FA|nr:RteC domain-containing protein [Pedobacter gandavensis]WGQ09906.1 RteC domain-containing protein [Pedobacter gandavensis]
MNDGMNENALRAFTVLEEDLKILSQSNGHPTAILREQESQVIAVLGDLRILHPFDDPVLEINFHKHLYPSFRSLLIYYQEKHLVCLALPHENLCLLKRHYQAELQRIARFFDAYAFHYKYFSLKGQELDVLFFTENADLQNVLLPVVPAHEPAGSTVTSELFARFMAYERLRIDLLSLLYELDPKPSLSSTTVDRFGKLRKPFKWTGETINLIEVAHAIHLNKQINEGEIGIVEFFEGLGEFFGVNLGVPKKGFDNMKSRKRLSRTQFLDLMRDSVIKKMDDEDDWGSVRGLL